jgi:hypothetical protein
MGMTLVNASRQRENTALHGPARYGIASSM